MYKDRRWCIFLKYISPLKLCNIDPFCDEIWIPKRGSLIYFSNILLETFLEILIIYFTIRVVQQSFRDSFSLLFIFNFIFNYKYFFIIFFSANDKVFCNINPSIVLFLG